MSHDIQYLFDNITAKNANRTIEAIQEDIDWLEERMSIDNRRKIAMANMKRKQEKLIIELERAKKKVLSEIENKIKKEF